MSYLRRAVTGGALALLAASSLAATASAETAPPNGQPWLVHATPQNECKLNLREGPDMTTKAITTLSCDNYTTCKKADASKPACGPYTVGGRYSCVGANGKQVVDNRWVEVTYRGANLPSYAAASCAAFRQ